MFSIIDLKSCFYQILLSARAQEFLGIITSEGTFIPDFPGFGPKNAPTASSRMLNELLVDLQDN